MGLDLEWNKGPRDFSKFASCNLKGNNFNQNIRMDPVAHNHPCPFLFSESRIFRPKIQGNTCILSRFLYPILSS